MAAHLYWRIYVETNNNDSFSSIGEVFMHTTPGGADVCTGGTPFESGHNGSDVAANAFDRTNGTRWAIGSSNVASWVGYQFAAPVDIVEFALKMDTSFLTQCPKRFWLEWSDDGVTFRTAIGAVNQTGWANLETRTYTKPALAGGAAVSWAVRCLDRMSNGPFGSADFVEIQDVEFRGTVGGADLTAAGGGTAIESSHNSSFVAANAFDTNATTFWQAAQTGKQYVGYSFPAAVAVAELALRATNGSEFNLAPLNFDVVISQNGTVFGAVYNSVSLPDWTQNLQRTFALFGPPLTPNFVDEAQFNAALAPPPATWNPLDATAGISFSNGNLTATTTSANVGVRADTPRNSGKLYFELHFVGHNNQQDHVGLIGQADNLVTPVSNSGGLRLLLGLPGGGAVTPVDVTYGFAVDFTAGTITYTVDGTTFFNAPLPSSILYPWFDAGEVGAQCTANFGGSAFALPVPAGFTAWNNGNPPAPLSPAGPLVVTAEAVSGDHHKAAYSLDGSTFTASGLTPHFPNGTPQGWGGLAFSPTLGSGYGRFVAVGQNGDSGNIGVMTSDDAGQSWTGRVCADGGNQWNGICWSPELNLFVAVASTGTNRVITSPDGIVWTGRTAAEANPWNDVAWSPTLGLFCAVATSGTHQVMTSPDGVMWTPQVHANNGLSSICWDGANARFVSVSSANGGQFQWSSDAITWANVSVSSLIYSWWRIRTDGAGNLLAVGGNSGQVAINAPNSLTSWTRTDGVGGITSGMRGCCWSPGYGKWFATSIGGIVSSPNGLNPWTKLTAPSNNWRDILEGTTAPPPPINLAAALIDEATFSPQITLAAPSLLLAAAFEDAAEFVAQIAFGTPISVQAAFTDDTVFLPQIALAPPILPPPVQTVVVLTG
jgi:hypothetical protein